jgi:hypothetical protein
MRRSTKETRGRAGFSLAETAVATAVFVLAGGLITLILITGVVLYAKNSSVNLAHDQARIALDRLERDIHSAVSIPVLVDENRVALNSTGPAAGVAFMLQASPNLRIAADVSDPTQNTIQVTGLGSFVPQVGERLVIPTYQLEADIAAVNGSTLTLVTSVGMKITGTQAPTNYNIVAYVADVVEYVLVNKELRFYKNASGTDYAVISRNLLNPTPFGLPFNPTQ